ncbi:hypothetical protein SAMN05216196_105310 [Lutimaribacter pacificus]|uniref:Uncharacterized protein n=1 Tax=Lutimaribacter pacificus TaxID=391948 RepID=A0A1H0JK18_9RHOB|nr:hypothetical protein [Lutimaribacter pacificus]SDO43974.1 hypothetical protein SAMN05216196_105310 [Lutimaribacter pacificus]SHK09326.1 hypothetical protein SAMN05444142_103230 [Lutimaribacter pacificus]
MTLGWAVVAIVVLMALVAVTRLIRRLVLGFAVAAAALLMLHYQHDPAAAGTALAALGGGVALAGPLRGLILRAFL